LRGRAVARDDIDAVTIFLAFLRDDIDEAGADVAELRIETAGLNLNFFNGGIYSLRVNT